MKFVTVYFSVFFLALTVAVSPAHAKQILVFGDSLSSGYGITEDEGWVAKLADLLVAEHKVANASVSGEDTVTGLARLPALLELNEPDLVIIELGGNDGLRAYQLDKMISLAKKSGAKVVLAGIRIPPNYGPRYTQGFANLFPELAREQQVAFLNMYIEDIVLDSNKMQSDGIHPAANAQPEIANYVHEFLLEENLLNE
jgi:acyl-CoA thioesterase-1